VEGCIPPSPKVSSTETIFSEFPTGTILYPQRTFTCLLFLPASLSISALLQTISLMGICQQYTFAVTDFPPFSHFNTFILDGPVRSGSYPQIAKHTVRCFPYVSIGLYKYVWLESRNMDSGTELCVFPRVCDSDPLENIEHLLPQVGHRMWGNIHLSSKVSYVLRFFFCKAGCWWLTAIMLSTWEPKIRRIMVQGQPRQVVHGISISKKPEQNGLEV
jgi:hypothetical protein